MNQLTLPISVYLAFLFLKCSIDAIYIQKKLVVPVHGLEWLQCASAAILAGMAYSNHFWVIVAFAFFLLPISWIVEDFTINAFLRQNVITQVGGGFWDKFFIHNFPSHTPRAIWISKITLLFIASWTFYEVTKEVLR